jgi:hypothetical protein
MVLKGLLNRLLEDFDYKRDKPLQNTLNIKSTPFWYNMISGILDDSATASNYSESKEDWVKGSYYSQNNNIMVKVYTTCSNLDSKFGRDKRKELMDNLAGNLNKKLPKMVHDVIDTNNVSLTERKLKK